MKIRNDGDLMIVLDTAENNEIGVETSNLHLVANGVSGKKVASGMTRDRAEEMARRWNAHEELVEAVSGIVVGYIKGDVNDAVLIDGPAYKKLLEVAKRIT